MLRSVAVIALDQVAAFELGVLAEVFGTDRTADGFPGYRFSVCTADGGPVRSLVRFPAHARTPTSPRSRTPTWSPSRRTPRDDRPRTGARRAARGPPTAGAWLLSVCSGAFVLGEAGLLDGRDCTTHWRYVDELQRRYPAARVRCNSLYVQDGRLLTSAGTAAGIDACLHLVRQEHGSATATRLARRMVVPPHRDGGQSQYVEAPDPEGARGAHPGAGAGMADGSPGPDGHRGGAGRARRHGAAYVRPPVPRRDRHHPARLADQPAGAAGPTAAGGDPAERGGGGRPGRLRRRGGAAAPLHPPGRHHPARYRTTFRDRAHSG